MRFSRNSALNVLSAKSHTMLARRVSEDSEPSSLNYGRLLSALFDAEKMDPLDVEIVQQV
jgi:hypothetical protein